MRLAFSWLTVFPVTVHHVDRAAATRAIAWAPVVGLVLGGIAAAVTVLPTPVAGLLAVGALALLTRGMHVDGLADTLDGLGVYGDAARAREIMRSGGIGPFGVAGVVFSVGVQALSFATLSWPAVLVAVVTGRVAVVLACRTGVAAAPDSGFGALVAGTQPPWVSATWSVLLLGGAFVAAGWLGVVACAAALVAATLLARHCVRRFGGLSGDVLGAVVETATAVAAVALTF